MEDEIHSSLKFNILNPGDLKLFFLEHLNHIYWAKAHLVERLPEIEEIAFFKDLKQAIIETKEDVERQMVRIDEIFTLLDSKSSAENCDGIIAMVEGAFSSIQLRADNSILRDLSILFYMQNIESIEISSFQILQIAAVKMKNIQITQLLKENYDETKRDRTLLLLIASKYISS